jgi:ferrochelatase
MIKIQSINAFIVMRCWHPRAEEVLRNVKNFSPDEIILMPLYPQYSAATSGSSIKEWKDYL